MTSFQFTTGQSQTQFFPLSIRDQLEMNQKGFYVGYDTFKQIISDTYKQLPHLVPFERGIDRASQCGFVSATVYAGIKAATDRGESGSGSYYRGYDADRSKAEQLFSQGCELFIVAHEIRKRSTRRLSTIQRWYNEWARSSSKPIANTSPTSNAKVRQAVHLERRRGKGKPVLDLSWNGSKSRLSRGLLTPETAKRKSLCMDLLTNDETVTTNKGGANMPHG
jgi:hypothetical protein